jgi:hypothetical protein
VALARQRLGAIDLVETLGREPLALTQASAVVDGHGIPGAIFGTSAVAAYLGAAATPFAKVTDPKPAWDTLLAVERAGLISVDRNVTPARITRTR